MVTWCSKAGKGEILTEHNCGIKFEMAAKILYQERYVTIWSGSPYSSTDTAN